MEIRITYRGINKDGFKGLWCGFKPDDIEVTEEILVLYPEKGKLLQKGEETFTSVVLEKEADKELYTEVDAPKLEEQDEHNTNR